MSLRYRSFVFEATQAPGRNLGCAPRCVSRMEERQGSGWLVVGNKDPGEGERSVTKVGDQEPPSLPTCASPCAWAPRHEEAV